jgi:hypothetical protein
MIPQDICNNYNMKISVVSVSAADTNGTCSLYPPGKEMVSFS